MLKKNRGGKLFLDVNRNGTAQTAVPAFAIRAKDGAPVAMPITWEELEDERLNARSWNIRNAVRADGVEDPGRISLDRRAYAPRRTGCRELRRKDFRRLPVRSCCSAIFLT